MSRTKKLTALLSVLGVFIICLFGVLLTTSTSFASADETSENLQEAVDLANGDVTLETFSDITDTEKYVISETAWKKEDGAIGGKFFLMEIPYNDANVSLQSKGSVMEDSAYWYLNVTLTGEAYLMFQGIEIGICAHLLSKAIDNYVYFYIPEFEFTVDETEYHTGTHTLDTAVHGVLDVDDTVKMYEIKALELPNETPEDEEDKESVGDWIDNKGNEISDWIEEHSGVAIPGGLILIIAGVLIIVSLKRRR